MAASINIDEAEAKICQKMSIPCLRPNQRTAIEEIIDKKDVFVGTKTGSGKSLTYEYIPVLFPESCVIIISPLISIMSEQCKKLTALGFTASYIGRDSCLSEIDSILRCEMDFIYASPEQLVGEMKWRDMLKSEVYQRRLKAILVDEALTVLQW